MEYILQEEIFYKNLFVDNGQKIRHMPGKKFKLFPFLTGGGNVPVVELDHVLGRYLCRIEGKEPVKTEIKALVEELEKETEIEVGQEPLFYEIVNTLFFDLNGNVRPLNLHMMEQISCDESSEKRIADYLVDVLGDKETLKEVIIDAKENLRLSSNVFENLVLSKMDMKPEKPDSDIPYYRVINSLKNNFEEDFKYILENKNRLKEYLVTLLEFYFLVYTAQTCLQLSRFMDGERDRNIPLYFSLEWEKTSQSRKCFTEGWKKLHGTIEKIFAHAIVLEILNQTPDETIPVDYIKINEIIKENPELNTKIANQIADLTDHYRKAIADCEEMNVFIRESSRGEDTAAEIRYLFNCVKTQFENTKRNAAYTSYSKKFEEYCRNKYLKSRGRSGYMLNLTEETVIFLTKVCIKDQEKMRLKDVFQELENRGVYLDGISKEQLAVYYEKLNLIEKKSDSGDAKYVKRIL